MIYIIHLLSLLFLPFLGAINTNSYPEVLTPKEEEYHLSRWKEKDYNSRNILIEHNLRLVAHIVKRYENTKEDKEDLLSIGSLGLIKAVDTFNFDSANKLSTYAARCIENEILMHLRKTYRQRQELSLDEVLSVDSEGNEMILADILPSTDDLQLEKIEKKEEVENLYKALNKLRKREREIIILRFGLYDKKAMTQKEVADLLGISQSYISRLEKRIFDKMRQEIYGKVRVS